MFELTPEALVGYLASALVVVSLTMTSVVRLRILSLCGSTTFVVYGALIDSAPIVITNALIAAINLWFLRREFSPGSGRGIGVGASRIRPDSPFLRDFVDFHLIDIHRFQPDFVLSSGDDVEAWLLTREGLPAGLLIGRRDGDTLTIDLDYVLGAFRDSRLGRWLFGPGAHVLRRDGVAVVRSHGSSDTHRKYLERIGFTPTADSADSDVYALTL